MLAGEVRKICQDTGRRLTNDSNAHGNSVLSGKISQKVGLAETIGENEGISGGFTHLRKELDQSIRQGAWLAQGPGNGWTGANRPV